MRNRLVLVLIALAVVGGLGYMLLGGSKAPADKPLAAASASKPGPATPVEFDLVRLSREGMGVIAGSAAPGGFVDVMAKGQSIGKSRASEVGSWEVVVNSALKPGTHVLGLTANDGKGTETHSADVAVVAVPEPPPKEPVKELKTAKGEKKPVVDDGVLAVMVPRLGEAAGRVLQRPGQLKPGLALGLELADFDGAGRTVLRGRASGGNDVNVYLDGRPVGTAKTDEEGAWTLTIPMVTAAPHNIRLEEIDPGNVVVLTVNQAFDPAVTLALDAAGQPALVRPDQTVWHMVRRQETGPVRYTQIFHADQGVAEGSDKDVKVPGILKPGSDI